jgi:RNA polymerase sigma-70 factor (ECF subfamily)
MKERRRGTVSEWRTVLEALVRDRQGSLIGYASLYAADRAAAEDLVQEALVRVFARARDLRSVPAAEQYVRLAIRTSFIDHARKQKTWRGKEYLFASANAARGPEVPVQVGMDVRAALGTLSPRERACIVLRFFEDLPVAAIAQELGVGTGSVKRYLSDGSAKLRVTLTDSDLDDSTESILVIGTKDRGPR